MMIRTMMQISGMRDSATSYDRPNRASECSTTAAALHQASINMAAVLEPPAALLCKTKTPLGIVNIEGQ